MRIRCGARRINLGAKILLPIHRIAALSSFTSRGSKISSEAAATAAAEPKVAVAAAEINAAASMRKARCSAYARKTCLFGPGSNPDVAPAGAGTSAMVGELPLYRWLYQTPTWAVAVIRGVIVAASILEASSGRFSEFTRLQKV